jgi:tetratricopeptide (TPR) repeat protein
MDGRWKLSLAAGALCGLLGCSHWHTRSDPDSSLFGAAPRRDETPAIGDSKTKPETRLALADVWLTAGEDVSRSGRERNQFLNEARKAYQQVLEKQPKNLIALNGLARCYAAMNDRDHALDVYRRAADLYPNEPRLWYDLGVVQGRFRDWESAADCFAEAVRLDPDNRAYRTSCGLTLARLGRVDDGFAYLRKGRGEAEAHFLMAKMMWQIEQPGACREQIAMALRAEPNYEPAHELLAQLSGGETSGPQNASGYNVQPARYDVPVGPAAQPQRFEMPAPIAPAAMPQAKPKAEPEAPEPAGSAKPAPKTVKAPPLMTEFGEESEALAPGQAKKASAPEEDEGDE